MRVDEYRDPRGNIPYNRWVNDFRDKKTKAKVISQVEKMEIGLFGDSEPIGEGLSELKIHFGPGYRVYYGKVARNFFLLLCGGDKSTQTKDIKLAKLYWADYQKRK